MRLTPRELEIISYIAGGKTCPEISEIFGTTHKTVRAQVFRLLHKVGAANKAALLWRCLELGLIKPPERKQGYGPRIVRFG